MAQPPPVQSPAITERNRSLVTRSRYSAADQPRCATKSSHIRSDVRVHTRSVATAISKIAAQAIFRRHSFDDLPTTAQAVGETILPRLFGRRILLPQQFQSIGQGLQRWIQLAAGPPWRAGRQRRSARLGFSPALRRGRASRRSGGPGRRRGRSCRRRTDKGPGERRRRVGRWRSWRLGSALGSREKSAASRMRSRVGKMSLDMVSTQP